MGPLEPLSLAARVVRDPVHWLAFGFGTGLLPVAPGTWASIATAIAFAWLPAAGTATMLMICAGLFVAGIWICGESARRIGVHDHGGIVLDEVVGMLLVLTVAGREPQWILAALLLFRAFDIFKPWPIRDLDHSLSGGLGIMLDDVVAAAYAAVCVYGLQRLLKIF